MENIFQEIEFLDRGLHTVPSNFESEIPIPCSSLSVEKKNEGIVMTRDRRPLSFEIKNISFPFPEGWMPDLGMKREYFLSSKESGFTADSFGLGLIVFQKIFLL